MPSELFTYAPEWTWLGVLYFFVGGIAGGAYFIAVLLDLLGNRSDRQIARLGYLIALPAIALGGIILIIDLKQPQRFWHMMVQSETFLPMFKWWSPISYGSWIISAFGLWAFVSFLAALVRPGDYPQRGPLRPFHTLAYGLGILSKLFLIVGAILGLWLASYTGVLLATTNRPVWANTNLISMLFLVSAVSTAAATLVLLALARKSANHDSVHALVRMDDWVLVLEFLVLIAVLVTLIPLFGWLSVGWLTGWGLGLLFVAVVGILIPLLLTWRPKHFDTRTTAIAAALVLLGGFVLRAVVVMSSEVLHKVVEG